MIWKLDCDFGLDALDSEFQSRRGPFWHHQGYVWLRKVLKPIVVVQLNVLSKDCRIIFENLETTLLSKLDKTKDQTVVVRIPFNLQVQDLVDILQIGVKNNLKFVIATSPK